MSVIDDSGHTYTRNQRRTQNQGVNLLCDASDFVNYDAARCEEADRMTGTYVGVGMTLFR
jgi:hypothetical protein